ncbi:hypothetical protein [Salisaeta longa]|uniref:hypothetical protein n=1 Tax=Salisaeta longa TaxID=503170 RepID=UPI0003B63C93|nr:hypothetical protein [Salisaeta longa]
MGAEIGPAIADAGPLIHLHEIGCLSFLQLFSVLHVPDAVWNETVGQGRVPPHQIESLDNVLRHAERGQDVQAFIDQESLDDLQYGEQACLWLLAQQEDSLVLTDDLAVRDAVKERGGTPVGSLGIVVRAYRAECIDLDRAERLLRRLHEDSTLFVTEAIVDLAVEQLRRRS